MFHANRVTYVFNMLVVQHFLFIFWRFLFSEQFGGDLHAMELGSCLEPGDLDDDGNPAFVWSSWKTFAHISLGLACIFNFVRFRRGRAQVQPVNGPSHTQKCSSSCASFLTGLILACIEHLGAAYLGYNAWKRILKGEGTACSSWSNNGMEWAFGFVLVYWLAIVLLWSHGSYLPPTNWEKLACVAMVITNFAVWITLLQDWPELWGLAFFISALIAIVFPILALYFLGKFGSEDD